MTHVLNPQCVLVTGGAGYIGSHACKALAEEGYTPVTFDNLVYGHRDAVRWGPLEEGDILDRSKLDKVIETYRPSAVMHFAAYAYVGESVRDPRRYYRNNVAGTLNLLESVVDHDIQRFVFSSTCAIYGVPNEVPIPESHPQHPINPYGRSKRVIEQMLEDFGAAYGLRSMSLRYFNAAGADPEGMIGEDHDPETHLIPLALDAAAGRRPEVTIFGQDYDTPDGTCIRDYVHVSDLADAHLRALRALESGASTAAYNLGTGVGHSVKEVIQVVRDVTGRHIREVAGARRPGDPPRLISDPGSVGRALGWSPRHSDLPTMIQSAWNWYQARFGDLVEDTGC